MHKVKVVGVKRLESGKFNGDTGEMENPVKGVIKWGRDVHLTEAGLYDSCEAILMTVAEYENLTSGKDWSMSESTRQGIRALATTLLDFLEEKE